MLLIYDTKEFIDQVSRCLVERMTILLAVTLSPVHQICKACEWSLLPEFQSARKTASRTEVSSIPKWFLLSCTIFLGLIHVRFHTQYTRPFLSTCAITFIPQKAEISSCIVTVHLFDKMKRVSTPGIVTEMWYLETLEHDEVYNNKDNLQYREKQASAKPRHHLLFPYEFPRTLLSKGWVGM